MLLYFAYGSNMLPAVMAERCPGARAHGTGRLHGWRFHITARGSASIVPRPGSIVHGVLWRCRTEHIHRLDRYEGVAWGNYRRRRFLIETGDGGLAPAFSYINSRRYPGRGRVTYMTTAVLPGARAFALPDAYVEELKGWLPDRAIGDRRNRYRGSPRPRRFPRF